MDPYRDPARSAEQRCDDLVGRLSLPEKAGLLFHPILMGDVLPEGFVNHVNLHALPPVREWVRRHNAMQKQAVESTPHGIPITFSSDPRHGFLENSGVGWAAGAVSQWPEPLGLAAIGDVEVLRQFADAQAQEYRALGLRCALHPQIDLATEPRWGRQAQTFGSDAALSADFAATYVDVTQSRGVACTTKHFPGGGPQRDGEDPHFEYGREQVYPGGRFDEHLQPFRAAIAAGTSAIMPYYGMPIGLEIDGEPIEGVGFAFNRRIITGLLRERLGYDGVVLTDWGLITDRQIFGKPFPARAWGVEHLSPIDRLARLVEAGNDQFGGEDCTDLLLELVRSGRVAESRIDASVRRVLLVKFRLGLFDNPYLDEEESARVVGRSDLGAAGHRAQAESVTVLHNDGVLPLRPGLTVYTEGVTGPDGYGTPVADPADADVAVVRLAAPYEPRDTYFLESAFHQGSLDFAPEVIAHIRELARVVPVVLDVLLDRPAILTPLAGVVAALVADYGCSDQALRDALTGRIRPRGRLPFELPRSMDAVRASRPDVPGDTADPLYRRGAGG